MGIVPYLLTRNKRADLVNHKYMCGEPATGPPHASRQSDFQMAKTRRTTPHTQDHAWRHVGCVRQVHCCVRGVAGMVFLQVWPHIGITLQKSVSHMPAEQANSCAAVVRSSSS